MKHTGIKMIALTLCLLLFSAGGVSAATAESDMADLLAKMSIMNGYPDGELHLDRTVTRAEFSKIAIAASPYKNQVASSVAVSPFSDVTYSHWAAPYIKLAVSSKLVNGYPDSTFRPDQTVLLEEAVTIFLKLLGYTNDDFGYSWPYGQVGLGQNLGLLDDVTVTVGTALTRGDVLQLTYNLLTCSPKGSTADYLEGIQYKLEEDVILIATNQEDSSVNPGRVATSGGSYKIDDTFNRANLGKRGDAVLKNNDTLVSFIPYDQSVEEYVVYALLNNAVVTYQNGISGQLTLEDSTIAYMGTQKTTFGALKSTMEMGDLLSVQRDSRGKIEYITVREGSLVGPVTVRSSEWYRDLSVSENITVMRDGVKCTASDIKTYDIVYYSADLNMVLAYSKKATGIYESASPNKDQLTSVTISGVTYEIESAEAFNALSSGGQFAYGDTVTVLLGKDGKIAGVASPSAASTTLIGYFCGAGVKDYTNQTGETYSNFYVTIADVEGNTFEYAAKRDYSDSDALNSVVKVTLSGGVASVASYTRQGLSGKVDAAAHLLGSTPISDSVKILDVVQTGSDKKGSYAPVYLQRLDQLDLGQKNILYYEMDSYGRISELILNDVTGECYEYGIITSATSRTVGMNTGGSYSYDIAGRAGSISTSGTSYNVGAGQPVMLLMADGRPQNIKALSRLEERVAAVTESMLKTSGGKEYKLSDKVVVYKKSSYDYTVIPISELSGGTYSMTAYYDRQPDRGGRIRVIIAEEKKK